MFEAEYFAGGGKSWGKKLQTFSREVCFFFNHDWNCGKALIEVFLICCSVRSRRNAMAGKIRSLPIVSYTKATWVFVHVCKYAISGIQRWIPGITYFHTYTKAKVAFVYDTIRQSCRYEGKKFTSILAGAAIEQKYKKQRMTCTHAKTRLWNYSRNESWTIIMCDAHGAKQICQGHSSSSGR